MNINQLIDKLSDKDPKIRYSASKQLILSSEDSPKKLYPYLNEFVRLLDSDNNIFVWTGTIIIGNLATIDKDDKIDAILPRLYKLLDTGKMITANNTIQALGKIAASKPKLSDDITSQLLKIPTYKYDTKECNNIACGQVILAFENYITIPDTKVLDFVKKISGNSRHATALKAQKLMKKYGKL